MRRLSNEYEDVERHVDDHRALFSFHLDEEDLGRIRGALDRGKKPKEDCYQWERGGGW